MTKDGKKRIWIEVHPQGEAAPLKLTLGQEASRGVEHRRIGRRLGRMFWYPVEMISVPSLQLIIFFDSTTASWVDWAVGASHRRDPGEPRFLVRRGIYRHPHHHFKINYLHNQQIFFTSNFYHTFSRRSTSFLSNFVQFMPL